ncbi:MAG: hypothetical protein AAF320_02740 [Myxococcota bacterium]
MVIKKKNRWWLVWTIGAACLSACGPDDSEENAGAEQQDLAVCRTETSSQKCARYLQDIKDKMSGEVFSQDRNDQQLPNYPFNGLFEVCRVSNLSDDKHAQAFVGACKEVIGFTVGSLTFAGKVKNAICNETYLRNYCVFTNFITEVNENKNGNDDEISKIKNVFKGINPNATSQEFFMFSCLQFDEKALSKYLREHISVSKKLIASQPEQKDQSELNKLDELVSQTGSEGTLWKAIKGGIQQSEQPSSLAKAGIWLYQHRTEIALVGTVVIAVLLAPIGL